MVMEYLSKAWKAYKRNALSIIVAMLIIGVVAGGFVSLALTPMFASIGQAITAGGFSMAILFGIMQSFASSLVIAIIGIVIALALQVGFVRMMVESLKGRTKVRTMFEGAKKDWLKAIIAYALAYLLMIATILVFVLLAAAAGLVGWVLLAIGILAVLVMAMSFVFINQAIVVNNASPTEALKKSYGFFKKNFLQVILLYLVYIVAVFVAALIPFIGSIIMLFLVAPVFLLALTALYMGGRVTEEEQKPKRRRRARKK